MEFLASYVCPLFFVNSGMRKDADGFTDIDWCVAQPLVSWNDLRQQFMKVRLQPTCNSAEDCLSRSSILTAWC